MVVCGDVEQSDLPVDYNDPIGNSFNWLLDRLWDVSKEIGVVELTKSDIVRHPLLSTYR